MIFGFPRVTSVLGPTSCTIRSLLVTMVDDLQMTTLILPMPLEMSTELGTFSAWASLGLQWVGSGLGWVQPVYCLVANVADKSFLAAWLYPLIIHPCDDSAIFWVGFGSGWWVETKCTINEVRLGSGLVSWLKSMYKPNWNLDRFINWAGYVNPNPNLSGQVGRLGQLCPGKKKTLHSLKLIFVGQSQPSIFLLEFGLPTIFMNWVVRIVSSALIFFSDSPPSV